MNRLIRLLKKLLKLEDKVRSQMLLSASLLQRQNMRDADRIKNKIALAEFKVFSQHGDDGIIAFLVEYLEVQPQTFVEFGVENYEEANTRYLLTAYNWSGLIMDGSTKHMEYVKSDNIYWKHTLSARPAFVTKENINDLLLSEGMQGPIGLLHIDIDGNDYWVWEAINAVQPVILILEYNSVFGPDVKWTVPYKADFIRTTAHHSNLYYGASLAALWQLSKQKGYRFVGCNSAGNNAYFVSETHAKDLPDLTPAQGFVRSKFRESRNQEGKLTYCNAADQLDLIKGLEVYDLDSQSLKRI